MTARIVEDINGSILYAQHEGRTYRLDLTGLKEWRPLPTPSVMRALDEALASYFKKTG